VGDYTIQFLGTFPENPLGQVTALGPDAEYCNIAAEGGILGGNPYHAQVRCFNGSGAPADTRYSITVLRANNAQQIAYAWIAGGNVAASYSWNPGGGITASSLGTGHYQVDFAGIANDGDHVEVTAYGNSNTYCYAFRWGPVSRVQVKCIAPNNTPVNSDFNVSYVKNTGQARLGFMTSFGNDINAASFTAVSNYRYSAGGGTVTVTRPSTGYYAVKFAGINPSPAGGSKGPNALAIGYGSDADPLRCSIDTIDPSGTDLIVNIFCFGTGGAAKNGHFDVQLFAPEQGAPVLPVTTFTTSPAGLKVVVDGVEYTTPKTFNFTAGTQHAVNLLSPQTLGGVTTTQYVFSNWGAGGCGNSAGCTITAGASDTTITANFTTQHRITVSLSGGGSVQIQNPPNSHPFYTAGSQVTLTAVPNAGSQFVNWTGGVTSSTNPLTVTMNAPVAITANFTGIPCTYQVTNTSMTPSPNGDVGSSAITTQAGCQWTAQSNVAWVAVTTNGGTGSGTVNYTVQANNTGAQRIGSATVAGQTVTFTQNAQQLTCAFNLSQTSITISSAGGTGSTNVNNTSGSNCAWTVTNTASWIILTAGASGGNGSGLVSFTALANSSTSQRVATLTIAGQSLTVTQLGSNGGGPTTTSALKFVPLTPCRLVDTRTAYAAPRTGAFGPPLLAAGSTRSIPIPSSITCSVPATAKAYVFNVTLDTIENGTGPVDFVTVYPTGEARPDFWTARTTTGGYIANAAIVKAGTGGSVDVFASNNVNFILDINGYFTDDVNTPGLLYYPIQPCRAVDTRGPTYSSLPAPYGNSRLQAGEQRTLRIPGSPACQIPVAAAYSTQLTLAPGELTNGNPVAFLTAWPAGLGRPNISNMNAFFGFAVANSGIIPASADGSINVFALDSTNLIIDVNGYFAPDDGTGRGLSYFATTQCRVMNTQDLTQSSPFGAPAMTGGVDRTLPVPAGRCTGLPTTAKAWAANATVVPGGSAVPFLSMWPSGTAWPNISQLNAFQGQTVSNSGIVPASATGSIDVRVAGSTHVAIEVAGYFARP